MGCKRKSNFKKLSPAPIPKLCGPRAATMADDDELLLLLLLLLVWPRVRIGCKHCSNDRSK
jgi:hypothetical protein